MRYEKFDDKIIVHDTQDFNVVQTLNCGQIFRYVIDGDSALVYSKDKCAKLITDKDSIVIQSSDIEYFEYFFDLSRDYAEIKKSLKDDELLSKAVDFGYGIRILNNDAYEMIVSFIISANNNISRIKKSIEYLCSHFGKPMGEYHAFPTLHELKTATVEDYVSAGLGYRAPQMYDTIQRLTDNDLDALTRMSPNAQYEFLTSLKGVGDKVANCILLFGLGVKNVFPVDTWINKVYNTLTNTKTKDRKKISKELTARFGEYSGFAQQYFFYYFRDNKLK